MPTAPDCHTSSAEWQSFELRMRQRRAVHCIRRADVALDAGFADDARRALDEARHLDPTSPAIAAMEKRLAATASGAVAAAGSSDSTDSSSAKKRAMLRATAGVGVALGLAGLLGWQTLSQGSARKAIAILKPVGHDIFLAAPALTEQVAKGPEPHGPSPTTTPFNAGPPISAPLNRGTIEHAAELLDHRATALPAEPRHEPATDSSAEPHGRPASEPPVEPSRAPPEPVPLPAPRIASGTAPKATSIVENEITAPAESAGVRAALARYEAAYSGLDASAARAVWPTVDERALARAFDGLAAQRLSLGNCDVRVNGDTAHAICAGRAAWTPKIGAGQRSATRQWSFDLRHADGAWYIYRVLMF